MNDDVQGKISQLSMMEQNIQNYAMQKQQFQAKLLEVESAETELQDATEAYKIIGNIMVLRDKKSMIKELEEKKKVLTARVESLEKQEEKLRNKAEEMQKEVLSEMKKKK